MTEQEKKYLKEIGCSEKEIARRELEERIDKAQTEYCRKNLLSGSMLSKQAVPAGIFYYHIDDPVIDREDGMTDEEIKAYRQEREKYSDALNDPLDAYRD